MLHGWPSTHRRQDREQGTKLSVRITLLLLLLLSKHSDDCCTGQIFVEEFGHSRGAQFNQPLLRPHAYHRGRTLHMTRPVIPIDLYWLRGIFQEIKRNEQALQGYRAVRRTHGANLPLFSRPILCSGPQLLGSRRSFFIFIFKKTKFQKYMSNRKILKIGWLSTRAH